MAFLPELERVEVDTPPPSPILFSGSFDTDIAQEIVSPSKRVRLNGGKPSKKRKRNNTVRISEYEPDGATLQPYCNDVEYPQADEVSTDGYTEYIAAVAGRRAGFHPLSDDLYIAQGWDDKSNYVKVSLNLIHRRTGLTGLQNTWYHLQRVVAGDDVHVACVCPKGRSASKLPCVHERYIQEYHDAILKQDYQMNLPNHNGPRRLPNHGGTSLQVGLNFC